MAAGAFHGVIDGTSDPWRISGLLLLPLVNQVTPHPTQQSHHTHHREQDQGELAGSLTGLHTDDYFTGFPSPSSAS